MRDEQSSTICPSRSRRPRNELATVQTAQRQYFSVRKEQCSEARAQSSALDVAKWRTSCFAATACCTKCHRPPQRIRTLSFEVIYSYEPLQDRRSVMRDERFSSDSTHTPPRGSTRWSTSPVETRHGRVYTPSTLPHPIPRRLRRYRKINNDHSFHLRPCLRDLCIF